MIRFVAILLAVLGVPPAAVSTVAAESPVLSALVAAIESGNRSAVQGFWDELQRRHAPLIEPLGNGSDEVLVTFLWRAPPGQGESNVHVMSPLGESIRASAVPERLARLADTDVWYRTYRASADVRFEYALTWPRGRTADPESQDFVERGGVLHETFTDPLNPRVMPSQWDEQGADGAWLDRTRYVSYAEGPHAPAEPYVAERPATPRGKVVTQEFDSAILGNRRRISVYTPPGLDRGSPDCDFLLVFDRAEYLVAVPAPTILDNMQADGMLRPIVAVFVGNAPGARSDELPPNPRFQEFLRRELLPWARARYRFTADPRRSVVAGSSFGGLASAYTALTNSGTFGNVLSQSGSYWWWPGFRYAGRYVDGLSSEGGWLMSEYATSRKLPLRFYLDAGSLEGALMLLPNRMFRDVLRAKGYEVTYSEFAGAHDYVAWRSTFSTGLAALIGRRPTGGGR